MSRLRVLGDVFRNGPGDWKLWVLHAVASPLLFVLFAGWLLIPESTGWQLGLSLVGVVVLATAALGVHSVTLGYLALQDRSAPWPLVVAFTRALRTLAAFAACSAAAYLLWSSANLLDVYRITFPAYVRAAMPAFVLRNVSGPAIENAYTAVTFVVRWILWPGLLLPFVAAVASFGFTGFVRGGSALWRGVRSGFYWVVIAAAAVAGVTLTPALVTWRGLAHDASFAGESISMAVRFSLAFVIALASWLTVCSMATAELRATVDTGGQATR
jgi:hypothetical protein